MTSRQIAEDVVQVTLVAAGSHGGLAARTLALHFGLRHDEADHLLAQGRGVIAAQVRETVALKAMPLLSALGLQIAIRPLGALAEPELYDLSLRLTTPQAATEVQAVLRRFGQDRVAAFSGPSGHVLRGLALARAETIAHAMRPLGCVQVTLSAQGAARYDLFGLLDHTSVPLKRHLSLLGCTGDAAISALAVDLDQRCLKHVLARFADCGLIGVNQLFQRYHVVLTGTGCLTRQEMQDFLITRGHDPRHLTDDLAAGRPVRTETGLARAAARQFLSDYAAIGIPARAELIRA